MDNAGTTARRLIADASEGRVRLADLDELATAVLESEPVRLALEVRGGGPLRVRRAIELAALVLGSAQPRDGIAADETH